MIIKVTTDCMHGYVNVWFCMHALNMCSIMHMNLHTTHSHIYICKNKSMKTHKNARTNARTHKYTHVRTYTPYLHYSQYAHRDSIVSLEL